MKEFNLRNSVRKYQPFFDHSLKSLEDIICLCLGLMVVGIVVFRAFTADITFDEAYSYMNTGRIQDFWKMFQFRIANTHILNSLLMTVSTLFFQYSDFAIRFPNVLASIVYVCIAFSMTKTYRNRLLAFSLLTLFHFMLIYMAQGRGYGLSATFILATLFVYQSKEKFNNYPLWMAYLSLLAFYANYVAIAPIAALSIYLFFTDFKRSLPQLPKLHKRWIVVLTLVGLYGFFSVTSEGKPLYGAYDAGFFDAIVVSYYELFWPAANIQTLTATIFAIGFVLVVVSLLVVKKKMPFGVIAIIMFSIIALMSFVAQKPLPTGRVLIPFWPLVALALIELIEKLTTLSSVPNVVLRILNVALLVPLVFNVVNQVNTDELLASKNKQWKLPIKSLSNYGKELNPKEKYYVLKDNQHEIISEKIDSYSFTEKNYDQVTVKNFEALQILEIEWTATDGDKKLYRKVYNNEERVYHDTLNVEEAVCLYRKDEGGATLFMPYPTISSDRLVIGSISNDWEIEVKVRKQAYLNEASL